ncbi:hypothetical protein AQUCO_00900731v1 [Aquilegia coerulea]|uniref:Transmembrane protein n=1 Tax=Aquilegia coerulea TaxID=218851 RepID=A0A2G5EF39_AQUCA|nr:hypothetical protein AQUCO_00900731v1 [Aquilegia coerulea]
MTNLSKLGIGLTVAFVFSFVVLVTELCYIFFRQRKRADDVDEESDISSSNCWSSKKFFYLFCCKNKSRIEHTGAPTTVHPVDDDNVVEQQDELMKWQELHGPSRILYTIKEEEKEDLESEKSCSERKTKKRIGGSIEEEKEISMVVISMESDKERETDETPYLTPCGSPPYCTPMSSPPHEIRRNDRNLMYYSESENCFVLEVEKSQRRLSSEKCFPVVICKKK